MRVGHVAGGKHAGQNGARAVVFGDNVARFVARQRGTEQLAVGAVTYGEEETVDGQVVGALFGRALLMHEVCAFHAALAIKSERIGLKKHFDFRIVQHALLHGL